MNAPSLGNEMQTNWSPPHKLERKWTFRFDKSEPKLEAALETSRRKSYTFDIVEELWWLALTSSWHSEIYCSYTFLIGVGLHIHNLFTWLRYKSFLFLFHRYMLLLCKPMLIFLVFGLYSKFFLWRNKELNLLGIYLLLQGRLSIHRAIICTLRFGKIWHYAVINQM